MRKFEEAELSCHKCKGWMKPAKIKFKEVVMRGWRCENCGEEALHPLDAQHYLVLSKLRKGIQVKVGEIKNAPYVRLTKDFSEIVHKGDLAFVSLKAPDEISMRFKHPHKTPLPS